MKTFVKTFALAVLVGAFVVLFTQCYSRSNRTHELIIQTMEALGDGQANYWKGRQDGYIRVLRTVANIMADYEQVPASQRRDRYDDMLSAVATAEPDMVEVYTVWKPNALDGTDSRYIGRVGSSPTGQYAFSCDKSFIGATNKTYKNIDTAMAHFAGPNAQKDLVEAPIARTVQGVETYVVEMMVPIINPRTNEVMGGVGCFLDIASIEKELMQMLMDHAEIAVMTIYANNGLSVGHFIPEHIGKMLIDVDEMGYGDYLEDAEQAVLNGSKFTCWTYDKLLKTDIIIVMCPFVIGNSDTTWTVTVVGTEVFFKRPRSPLDLLFTS